MINKLLDRLGLTEKLSESDRLEKYLSMFDITDSVDKQMCITGSQIQKQAWLIRLMNGFVRPFGGIGALATEFYAIWGENLALWSGYGFAEIQISIEQHIVLGTIIAFYFGSRLKETLTGKSTAR